MKRKIWDNRSLKIILSFAVVSSALFSCAYKQTNYNLFINDDGVLYLENDKELKELFKVEIKDIFDLKVEKGEKTWFINGIDTKISIKNDINSYIFIGFDGYVWNKDTRTNIFVGKFHDHFIDNTLPILNDMGDFFIRKSIPLADKAIVLMNGFNTATKTTYYSNQHISTLEIDVAKEGTLSIGTCKIRNAINARTDADTFYFDEKASFTVKQGLNSIPLDFDINDDETLVFKGSAALTIFDNVPSNSLEGSILIIDSYCHDDLLDTNEFGNIRLAIKTNITNDFDFSLEKNEEINALIESNFYGKTFSILGDSLSSFEGVSNNSNINSHLKNNKVEYTGHNADVTDSSQMWFYQLASDFNMTLLVDNACSGATIMKKGIEDEFAGYNRCMYLSRDNGEYKDISPDYIFILMGGNDCLLDSEKIFDVKYETPTNDLLSFYRNNDDYIEPELYNFTAAYMITVDKIKSYYPDSKIFIIGSYEIILSKLENYWVALNKLNDNLEALANFFDVGYLCLRNNPFLHFDSVEDYLANPAHPNKKGFNHFSDQIEIELTKYLIENNKITKD